MMLGRFSAVRSKYPIPAMAIKLLMVRLTIMATVAGKALSISGGLRNGKNIER